MNYSKIYKPLVKINPDTYEAEEQQDFRQEICFIAKYLGISQRRIYIDSSHPVGEYVIFIDGKYNGYLDQDFYWFMLEGLDSYGEYEEWRKMYLK